MWESSKVVVLDAETLVKKIEATTARKLHDIVAIGDEGPLKRSHTKSKERVKRGPRRSKTTSLCLLWPSSVPGLELRCNQKKRFLRTVVPINGLRSSINVRC
jgi:hypothetical protein